MAVETNRPLVLHPMPQITSPVTTQTIMRNVVIALVPSFIAAVVFFGIDALVVCGTQPNSS